MNDSILSIFRFVNDNRCDACAAGQGLVNDQCVPCAEGEFSNSGGCEKCPPGSYSEGKGVEVEGILELFEIHAQTIISIHQVFIENL